MSLANSVQNLYEFGSDYGLDVYDARLYPFDTYVLTTNIRIERTNDSSPVTVTRLLIVSENANFLISSSDAASTVMIQFSSSSDVVQSPTRDLNLTIRRPGEARFFALLLFGVNWMLAHLLWRILVALPRIYKALSYLQAYHFRGGSTPYLHIDFFALHFFFDMTFMLYSLILRSLSYGDLFFQLP